MGQHRGDLVIAQRLARQCRAIPGHGALWQELQRSDAIAPDSGQGSTGINTFRPDPFRQSPMDVVTVRQQFLEDRDDRGQPYRSGRSGKECEMGRAFSQASYS